MRTLASKRPVFHSEADFQHALAMQIAGAEPGVQIRLEYRPFSHERIYLDLWVSEGSRKLAIELKYKTRAASIDWLGERFDLANQGAQDLGAYDVWKDVQRVESVCAQREDVDGYVIFLSNDTTYWSEPASDVTVGSAFRLHEGRVAGGGLFWASHAGEGTMKNRENPVVLNGTYRIAWHDYSRLGSGPELTLRYTIIPISAKEQVRPVVAAPPTSTAVGTVTPVQPVTGRRRSKYSPLHDFLVAHKGDRVELSYSQIEEIIGSSLPASSRKHSATFWANHYGGTHVWATQWMDAGWKVASHNISAERVVFIRVASATKAPPR